MKNNNILPIISVLKNIFILIVLMYSSGVAATFSIDSNSKAIQKELDKVKKEKANEILKLERKLADNTEKTHFLNNEINKVKLQLDTANTELDILDTALDDAEKGVTGCIKYKNKELKRIKDEKRDFSNQMPNKIEEINELYANNLKELDSTYNTCLNEKSVEVSSLITIQNKLNDILAKIKISGNNLGKLESRRGRLLEEAKNIQNRIDTLNGKIKKDFN